ncbi:MAG: hypothetical protein E6K54_08905, partial [Gammaproteobacteria bacterium]
MPIYKSGEKTLYSNYRPISLLSVCSKILEKCIKLQLSNYLNENKLITEQQFGFRCNKNTSDALFEITKYVSNLFGVKNKVLITFLDIAKAFDCVSRQLLLQKLHSIGVQNNSY